jgi:epoxyqueuosine reductase
MGGAYDKFDRTVEVMANTTLSTMIREYAFDIGYSRVGIAPADDFDEYLEVIADSSERYDWWVQGPREPAAWARLSVVRPQAKSLIVLVYDYAQHHFPPELCAMMGRIYQARCYFAPSTNINGARLDLMKRFLENEGLTCEDVPWLPQRWAGVRAGVTHFGKNTFAYAEGMGSFVMLSTLLVDVELDYDEPGPVSTCPENCTRCLDACPTGALFEPFRLNPRRCLPFNAWMTTKGRGFGITDNIPHDIRPLMQQHIHGCDLCQEACPRNQRTLRANKTRSHDALLDLLAKELTLDKLLHMPEGYYESYVRPIMYNYIRDLRLFQRNAAVAIGNTHDARYLPDLAIELDNPDAVIRAHVVWALGQLALAWLKVSDGVRGTTTEAPFAALDAQPVYAQPPDVQVRALLTQRLAVETDMEVREELARALAALDAFVGSLDIK